MMSDPHSDLPGTAQRVLLLGTPDTLSELRARLAPLPNISIIAQVGARPEDSGPDRAPIESIQRLITERRPDLVLLSLPAWMTMEQHKCTELVRAAGTPLKQIPPIADLLTGSHAPEAASSTTDAALDLQRMIGRPARPVNAQLVRSIVGGERVLITGAGGSIGSELARIVAEHNPEQIILVDRSENALFEIDRTLGAAFPDVPRTAILHDVVDAPRTAALLDQHKPTVIYHAAAHKHVPMMEDHPGAAVTNNIFGTRSVLDAAIACGAGRFVLVSTDKAVHPTSVMGATKRMAELYVRSRANTSTTSCAIVRFGNVLGSACSVLPIWEHQLAEGRAMTVTDERMTRYFMTIPEAASLVIQASGIPALPGSAGVFVLDMGEPVRIADLARRFLEHRGLEPGVGGIEIQITGARPGEKLHEELAYSAEELEPTDIPGVRSWGGGSIAPSEIDPLIAKLDAIRSSPAPAQVLSVLRSCLPEMTPQAITRRVHPGLSPSENPPVAGDTEDAGAFAA